MNIEKKIWPENFERILNGEKNVEFRLANFEIKDGDSLILREYDKQNLHYTGRRIIREVLGVKKVDFSNLNFDGAYTQEQLNEFGVYKIELKRIF